MPDDSKYECEVCDYWEALHGLIDYHSEKYKKCMNCRKRLAVYRSWIENNGDKHA